LFEEGVLEIGTEDMVAVLDAVDDGGEFATHPAVHTGAEDGGDLVAGEPPQTQRVVGYRRYEGLEAAAALGRLYAVLRLFVNFFQPSFKLAGKVRDGAKVSKTYHPPATPYQRLLADARSNEDVRRRATAT
jgi:hypothetical protein